MIFSSTKGLHFFFFARKIKWEQAAIETAMIQDGL